MFKFKNVKLSKWIHENLLLLLILMGVVVGLLVGIFVNGNVQSSVNPSPTEIAMYISFPGQIFLRMLKLLILPLMVSSVVASLAILDSKSAAKLGKRAATYFFITTFIAVILGVILATVLKPGVIGSNVKKSEGGNVKAIHAVLDLIRNILPDNIVEAASSSTATKFKKRSVAHSSVNNTSENYKASSVHSLFRKKKHSKQRNISLDSVGLTEKYIYEYDGLVKYNATNLLGILAFSIVFGVTLSSLGSEGKSITKWFICLFKATMKMVEIFMWFSPIGICSMIAGSIAAMDDIRGSVGSLGMYVVTVTVACLLHAMVTLPSIYFLVLRRNPFHLLIQVAKALLTGFGTASASATLPVTLTCLQNDNGDQRVSRFVIPIGTIVNKDAMAIYNAVAAIYIAQTQHGGSLDFGSSILVCFAAMLSSIAAASVPASGPLVTSTIVLQAIGIRSADIGLILAVDWFLDRVVTSVNIWGNCVGSVIVEHLSREDLKKLDDKNVGGLLHKCAEEV